MYRKIIHSILHAGHLAGLQPKTTFAIIAILGFTVFMAPTQASAAQCVFIPGFGWFCW